MSSDHGIRLTADELNRVPAFSPVEQPVHEKAPGQVWTVKPDLTKQVPRAASVPPLFPVVLTRLGPTLGKDKLLCTVAPLHHLRENAASDDLFCTIEDGCAAEYMIASWADITMFASNLDKCIGNVSAKTFGYLRELLRFEGGDVPRERTGTSIVNRTDFRLAYRADFIEQISLLSAPVERYVEMTEDSGDAPENADVSDAIVNPEPEIAQATCVVKEPQRALDQLRPAGFLILFTTTGMRVARAPAGFRELIPQRRGDGSKGKKTPEAVYSGIVGAFEVTLCVQRKGRNVGDIHLEIMDNVRNELPKLRATLSGKGRENSRVVKSSGKRGSTVFAGIDMGEYVLKITEGEIERVSLTIKLATK